MTRTGTRMTTAFGCTGSITTTVPAGHDPATEDLRAVFDARRTPTAAAAICRRCTGTDEVVIEPTG